MLILADTGDRRVKKGIAIRVFESLRGVLCLAGVDILSGMG